MKWLALLLVASVALAGCGNKDKLSTADMVAQVDDALAQLEADLGPAGRISGADLLMPVDAGFATITVPLSLEIGPAGDMRLDASFGVPGSRTSVVAYCSAEKLVIITEGLEEYTESEDYSVEMRNRVGSCTRVDGGASDVLGGFSGVNELVGDGDRIVFEDVKKEDGALIATFIDRLTGSALLVDVQDDRVERIRASADEGELSIDFHYETRVAPIVPIAQSKLPAAVAWSLQKGAQEGDPGIVSIAAGDIALDQFEVRVYGKNFSDCVGGPAPLVAFSLADGLQQSRDGFDLDVRDDGDGILDKGDKIYLWHPERFQEPFGHHVEIWDAWSDSSAHPDCVFIPGPAPALIGIGLLALVALVRRR